MVPQPHPGKQSGQIGNSPPKFETVSTVRSYQQIVQQVENAVRQGRLTRGERLPTERELAAMFDVSRGVVREAIKVLDAMGLVVTRQGSGLYVRNDTIPSVTRAFILSVSPDSESVERLFEFRRGLEIDAARHAATRRTDDDIIEIQDAVETGADAADPDDWLRFTDADARFHAAIANASGNAYLAVAIATSRDMQRDVVKLFSHQPGSIKSAIDHHQHILDAIITGDAEAAATHMAEHIDYTAGIIQLELSSAKRDEAPSATGEHG